MMTNEGQHKRMCAAINAEPLIQSLLYDLNILPEQTADDPVRYVYTWTVVQHMREQAKRATARYLMQMHEKHKDQHNHFACAARALEDKP